MAIVFSASFCQYFFQLSPFVQIAPLAVLALAALIGMVLASRRQLRKTVSSLLHPSFILLLVALLIPLLSSGFSGHTREVEYALLLVGTLITVRVILSVLTIEEVLRAFAAASVFCSIALVIEAHTALSVSAVTGVRFGLSTFHPNLIGFLLAGFFSVQLWAFQTSSQLKPLWVVLCSVEVGIIVLASSRGSIVAVGAGLLAVTGLSLTKSVKVHKLALIRWQTAGIVMAITIGVFLLSRTSALHTWVSYVSDALKLHDPYRGLDTGLTGRTTTWAKTIEVLNEKSSWITGDGFRSRDELIDSSIDNGYLALLYEAGLIVAFIVVVKFFYITYIAARRYLVSVEPRDSQLLLAVVCCLVVFLTNNLVARYLFGIGNPFSIIGLFLIVMAPGDVPLRRSQPSSLHLYVPESPRGRRPLRIASEERPPLT